MLRVDEMHFNATRFQNLKQRNPVHTGGLRHRVDAALLQPIGQSVQILCKGGKRYRVRIPVGRNGDENLGGSNINTPSVGSHLRQTPIQFPMLPSLCFGCHGSSPLSNYGNEPGVQKGKSFNRDHRNIHINRCCASPMLWRTGLESNSLTGSSIKHWACDLHLPSPSPTCGTRWGRRHLKVPSCYGAGQQAKLGVLLKHFVRRSKTSQRFTDPLTGSPVPNSTGRNITENFRRVSPRPF